jgi:2-iminobutanoate/2-iminopropanoate deaminase
VSTKPEVIRTPDAPAAIGPYSQAQRVGPWVLLSGQIALDPQTGTLVGADAAAQAERCLENARAVLRAAGAHLADVVRATLYLRDMAEFEAVNRVYGRFFPEHPPARSTVQVAGLPRGAAVEIELTAYCDR